MKSKNKVVDILNRAWKSLLLPAIVFLAFTLILGEDFLNSRLLLTIARQTAMPILLAFSMALMMFMGMMNFAMGAVLYTAVILGAYVAQSLGGGIPLIFVFTVIFAIIFMAINGWLYNLLKVPCIVLSLGLALVIEALGRMLVPSGVAEIGGREGYLAQSPYCFVILLIGFIIFYVVFNYTTFGHNVRAIGESQQVATQAGINVARTKFIAFVLSGLFVGMASMLFLSSSVKIYAASNLASLSQIFDSMMGVFIAMFLARYCGFPLGLVIGVATMRMVSTGLVTAGMRTTMKSISTGVFLLAVLIFSVNQSRPAAYRQFKHNGEVADKEYQASLK